jgi:hypothetical protein
VPDDWTDYIGYLSTLQDGAEDVARRIESLAERYGGEGWKRVAQASRETVDKAKKAVEEAVKQAKRDPGSPSTDTSADAREEPR